MAALIKEKGSYEALYFGSKSILSSLMENVRNSMRRAMEGIPGESDAVEAPWRKGVEPSIDLSSEPRCPGTRNPYGGRVRTIRKMSHEMSEPSSGSLLDTPMERTPTYRTGEAGKTPLGSRTESARSGR